jgi:hypothetical protein
MSKTAVGLFQYPSVAKQVIQALDANEFPRNDVRVLDEPLDMGGDGPMSTPHVDFEVGLSRQLTEMGATRDLANAYVRGVKRGGVLIFATGTNAQVDLAAEIMNRHNAVELEELMGSEMEMDEMGGETMSPIQDGSSSQTGRISQTGSGARMFVW